MRTFYFSHESYKEYLRKLDVHKKEVVSHGFVGGGFYIKVKV
jgi:hypothetical protein